MIAFKTFRNGYYASLKFSSQISWSPSLKRIIFIWHYMWVRSLGWEHSLGIKNGNPLQYSCLENSMNREACWATDHRVTWSWTRISIMHAHKKRTQFYTCEFTRADFCRTAPASCLDTILTLFSGDKVTHYVN